MQSHGAVRLSLVISTRNRAEQLRRCLASLLRLDSAEPWELVIVDNGSSDHTGKVAEEFRQRFVRGVTVLQVPEPGLGRARNHGWRAAHGEIVAFTDDDCYPDAAFVSAVVDAFAAEPTLGFLGGRIRLHDPTDYPITIQENPRPIELPPRRFIPAGLIQGANFALRRTALEAIGGFDPLFGAGALFPCEDVDVVARASAAGWRGAYDPAPLVYHHHGRKTPEEASRLMRQYDHGRGAYYTKCLLDPALRRSTLKHWCRQMARQPPGCTWRELRAACQYLLVRRTNRRTRVRAS
jgi:glycosyltransferase involved in cell wall biosynthesis